jgi:DNA-binding response OmpR family regulator
MYTEVMSKSTILLVEDERKIAEITKVYLERDGFRVLHATTGEEALGLLKESPDLILLDLMLPDMDGEEICRLVRKDSEVPIIMVTAKSDEDERVRGLGLGADDYVVKPFSPRELVARVKAQLRRHLSQPNIFSFNEGALEINVENHEVKRAAEVVTLTPTEFKILLSLAERPEIVMSRLQLVNIVQGYDFEGYERTIDAHVKNLRHKIESNPRAPEFIKTIYAMGYKFIGTRDAL